MSARHSWEVAREVHTGDDRYNTPLPVEWQCVRCGCKKRLKGGGVSWRYTYKVNRFETRLAPPCKEKDSEQALHDRVRNLEAEASNAQARADAATFDRDHLTGSLMLHLAAADELIKIVIERRPLGEMVAAAKRARAVLNSNGSGGAAVRGALLRMAREVDTVDKAMRALEHEVGR